MVWAIFFWWVVAIKSQFWSKGFIYWLVYRHMRSMVVCEYISNLCPLALVGISIRCHWAVEAYTSNTVEVMTSWPRCAHCEPGWYFLMLAVPVHSWALTLSITSFHTISSLCEQILSGGGPGGGDTKTRMTYPLWHNIGIARNYSSPISQEIVYM